MPCKLCNGFVFLFNNLPYGTFGVLYLLVKGGGRHAQSTRAEYYHLLGGIGGGNPYAVFL